MQRLEGGTAVVTGAASGIGRALAERFAAAGMRLVLADIEEEPLAAVAASLRGEGAEVLAMRTDVAEREQVDALAAAAAEAFGPVHLLCNNAGVGAGGLVHELRTEDWQWVLGVNLWGVIHGLGAFLPGMLGHGEDAHIVNTASVAGLVSAPFMAPYGASKFAVVAISEALHHELEMTGAKVGVSVLCPGWVNTRIHESHRNRPAELGGGSDGGDDARAAMLAQVLQAGMAPARVAELVHDAIVERRFYVITHPEMLGAVEQRMQAILQQANPTLSAGAGGLLGSAVAT